MDKKRIHYWLLETWRTSILDLFRQFSRNAYIEMFRLQDGFS